MSTTTTTATDPRDIITERDIDAPANKILRAVSDPAQFAQWWGPKGFRNTFSTFDFRPGGEWKFTMHGPDGTDYENHNTFDEISPSRIVIRHVNAPHFTLTMTLEPRGGQTHVHWQQRFETAQLREQLAAICIPANEQNFDRLEAVLAANNR